MKKSKEILKVKEDEKFGGQRWSNKRTIAVLKGKNLVNRTGKLLRDIKWGNFSQIKTY